MGFILSWDTQEKTEEINALSQYLKYRDTNPCWLNNSEERIKFIRVSLLSDTLWGYWLHQDDRCSGGKLNNDKFMDLKKELKKASIDRVGKGM